MPPAAGTVARPWTELEQAQILLWVCVGVVLLVAVCVWWMDREIERGCKLCSHCQARERDRQALRDARKAENEAFARDYERKHRLRPPDDEDKGL